jgi:solute carrier family 35, member E1
VFAAIVALAVPPTETKPFLAYLMLLVIVGGVGLACVKEGKVVHGPHHHTDYKCCR